MSTREILFVRHAIAEDRPPGVAAFRDSDRVLTADGVDKMRAGVKGLHKIIESLDLIVSSPYKRAWQTAEILKSEFSKAQLLPEERLVSGSDFENYLEVISEQSENRVALVAHEPDLGLVVSSLLGGPGAQHFFSFKKGGMVLIEFSMLHQVPRSRLLWAIKPSQLRKLGDT